jgi:hypothetical protein
MAVGFPISKAGFDTQMGLEIGAVASALAACRTRLLWLNNSNIVPGANLGTGLLQQTLGYTATEETNIRTAYADLDSLAQIAHGVGTKGVATVGSSAALNDFFFKAILFGGPNYYGA